jgi:hypothetical protein
LAHKEKISLSISNKIRSANSFTDAIDTPVEINAYGGETADQFGISYLNVPLGKRLQGVSWAVRPWISFSQAQMPSRLLP